MVKFFREQERDGYTYEYGSAKDEFDKLTKIKEKIWLQKQEAAKRQGKQTGDQSAKDQLDKSSKIDTQLGLHKHETTEHKRGGYRLSEVHKELKRRYEITVEEQFDFFISKRGQEKGIEDWEYVAVMMGLATPPLSKIMAEQVGTGKSIAFHWKKLDISDRVRYLILWVLIQHSWK